MSIPSVDVTYSDGLNDNDFMSALTAAIVPDPITLVIGYEPAMMRKGGLRPSSDQSRVYTYGVKASELFEKTNGDMRFQSLNYFKVLGFPLQPSSVIINAHRLSLLEGVLVRKSVSKASVGTVIMAIDYELSTSINIVKSRHDIKILHVLSNGSIYASLGIVTAPELEGLKPW